jgi:hypothetical protein
MQTGAMPCGLTPWEKVIHVQHERVNLVAAQFAYVVVGKEGKSGLRIESRDNEVYLPKNHAFMWTISQSLSKRSRKMPQEIQIDNGTEIITAQDRRPEIDPHLSFESHV